jgi:cytochrome c peroxidase
LILDRTHTSRTKQHGDVPFVRRLRANAFAGFALAALLVSSLAGCGGGGADAASTSVVATTAAATPNAPTGVSASAISTGIVVSFTAPAVSGGAAISAYVATCSAPGAGNVLTGTAAVSPIFLTGVVNGTTYACTVAAVSAAGTGAASSVASVNAVVTATAASTLSLDLNALANYAAPALPAYYDAAVLASDNMKGGNAVTNAGATLGRVLFYDKSLSVNDTIACASCHQQASGFDDPARFSAGFSGSVFGTAHAMRLGNMRYFAPGTAFWNRRAATIENQATQPVQNPIEMGYDASHGGFAAVLAKLQALPYYVDLFTLAFGDASITEARIQDALAQFERAMVSVNSRWDTGYASVYNAALADKGLSLDLPGFTAQENRGRALFMAPLGQGGFGCAACHAPPTFALAADARSNGLDAGETTVFKAPSLKNVARSKAFMHDGRFATLDQVLNFYDDQIQAGPALDSRLVDANGRPRRLNINGADRAALVAFLNTLSDPLLVADPKLSTPFK